MTATNSFQTRPVHRRHIAVVALALAALTSGAGGIYVAAETTPTPQPVAVTAAPPPPTASALAPVTAPAVRPAAPTTTKRKSPATATTKTTSRKTAASAGDPADSPFCSKNPDLCTNGVPDKKSDRAVYQNDQRSNAEINSDQPMYAPEGICPGGYARIAGIC